MPHSFLPGDKQGILSFQHFWQPVVTTLPEGPPIISRGNKPIQMDFEQQLKALVFFHLEEHTSGRHLLQVLEDDEFARSIIAPPNGIKKSTFFETINSRGLEQLLHVFEKLYQKAARTLPDEYAGLGDLVAIDGSLIDACLSMTWADYREGAKKAKVHVGFDLNRSIPCKVFLTDGKADERPFADHIIAPGQTGVLDRYYQCHKNFDRWQAEGKCFVCRIKANTKKTVVKTSQIAPDSIVFFDAIVLLGTPGVNQTKEELRLVGYYVDNKAYWVATNRLDLSAEQIAAIYKLRWQIEKFFAWWKRHLRVYHLIARSPYGLMVQVLSGLITYLLLAIYCHNYYQEKVSIKRVRELRIKIQNETRDLIKNDKKDTKKQGSKTQWFIGNMQKLNRTLLD
jgi:hypothetical protein